MFFFSKNILLQIYIYFSFFSSCVVTEKERINSGFFLYQAELKKKKEKKEKKMMKEEKTKTVKQLENLLDEDTMGRIIDFDVYGLCHHCKIVKHIETEMVRCKYSSFKSGVAIPASLTIRGVSIYNGTKLLPIQ